MDVQAIRRKLQKSGQEHVLAFVEELDEPQRKALLDQVAALDWEQMDALVRQYVRGRGAMEIPSDLVPPEVVPVAPSGAGAIAEKEAARRRGEELLAAGKVAAFVVAGGQGTRLGFDGPKGCLEATPVAHKPLFRLFAEKIVAASRRYRVRIPWYIMTSPATDVATKAHFRQNDFWGFSPKDVVFLMQGVMPAFSAEGKVLLSDKRHLALSPDGHGGSLPALRASGALEDMARRGVELISYFQVDNPLVRCIDPLFLGLHEARGAEMSAKAVAKRSPLENLGNLCLSGGRLHVIEYMDMPNALAEATGPDGRLKFSAGSIGVHVLSRSFVERLTEGGRCTLPFHRAEKAVPHVDAGGRLVKPEKPNAVKLERFVFDALPLAKATVVLETLRSEEFSPIKNASGSDSLSTSLYDQVRRWAVWMEKAGVKVPRDADGQVAAAIEISPLFADSAEELAAKVDRKLAIATGQAFYLGSRGQIGGSKP
jgi:UDP-N-acetylglucosamine/UDP-N-acetylgalactosamine diphosphorylase